jgi:hypothetical protein
MFIERLHTKFVRRAHVHELFRDKCTGDHHAY